ncbi:MAG: hypothetical protein ACI88H_003836 [Cocleimonas sp.]|jgi:hypothetical protein
MLYELRDKPNLVTYSYWSDITGKLHKVCEFNAIGFGMPFAAPQYTAPSIDRVNTSGGAGASTTITRHQPEPSQLYMPTVHM